MQEISEQTKQGSLTQHIPIYTVGYGRRSVDQFLALLYQYDIKYLVDIRSQPYSTANQQFSKDPLEKVLKQHHIRYLFMGDTLGGRPKDDSCYVDGRVDYSKVREKRFYQEGISRLHTAWEKQYAVALMCAETKPQECHRSKLVGNTLRDENIEVAHIDETGKLKTQYEVNYLLLGGGGQLSLFDDQSSSDMLNENINFSRKKYSLPSERTL